MYSPTTRLLSVLELLQSRKQMSGVEIARRLEVNPRTVRRYITMLQDLGIPVEGERGPYGSYQLKRGQRLPPLMFTAPEAIALTLGMLTIRALQFPVEAAAVESALAKLERVLPERLLNQVQALQETIIFHTDLPPGRFQNEVVTGLSLAAQQRQTVRLRYCTIGGVETERQFDTYGLVFNEGYWYTAGYCHLRRDLRVFRLDRVVEFELLEAAFERPEGFNALDYVLASLYSRAGVEQVEVLMQTTMDHAQEVVTPDLGTLEETETGLIFRRAAIHLEWLAFFLMGLDFPVRVLGPEALRKTMRQMAARAIEMVEG